MAILLKNLQSSYLQDSDVINQIQMEFGLDYTDLEKEWDDYWAQTLMNQIINESSNGNGEWAGAGPIDYNEGKVLYLFIRTKKPQNILEVGFASGVKFFCNSKSIRDEWEWCFIYWGS